MRTVRLPCGCRHELERERWLELCPVHQAEADETHERWRRERVEAVLRSLEKIEALGTFAHVPGVGP